MLLARRVFWAHYVLVIQRACRRSTSQATAICDCIVLPACQIPNWGEQCAILCTHRWIRWEVSELDGVEFLIISWITNEFLILLQKIFDDILLQLHFRSLLILFSSINLNCFEKRNKSIEDQSSSNFLQFLELLFYSYMDLNRIRISFFMKQNKNVFWIESKVMSFCFLFSFHFISKKNMNEYKLHCARNFWVIFDEVRRKKFYGLCWVLKIPPEKKEPALTSASRTETIWSFCRDLFEVGGLFLGCCVCLVFKTSVCLHKFPSRYFIDLGVSF